MYIRGVGMKKSMIAYLLVMVLIVSNIGLAFAASDGNKKEYAVQLYVNKEISHLFKRKKISPSQRIIKNYEDDSIDIELFITNDMEIIPTIQKFIPYIKIIGPISLEKKCMENIENYKQF